MDERNFSEVLVRGVAGQFVRKYRRPNSFLFVERYENQIGVFLKFSQVRNIMVPGGHSLWGWKKMVDCLENIVGRGCG